jgi:hypothetical protein
MTAEEDEKAMLRLPELPPAAAVLPAKWQRRC